jgi:hypothetical protein
MNEPDWLRYERTVQAEIASKYPRARVTHDARRPGKLSGAARQIDILIEEAVHDDTLTTVVDAKHHARPIDVKDVEMFLGLLADVDAPRGIMVSAKGYTKAALARAFRDDVDLDLEICSLDDYKDWQVPGAIPYSGRNAVLLPAPLGWVVDAKRRSGTLAYLYRRGLTLEDAGHQREFMYVNLQDRQNPADTLDALVTEQNADILSDCPDASITVDAASLRDGTRTCIRRADVPSYPSLEITGFVEFPDVIFFAVLFTPAIVERRNVRKLEYLLRSVLPMSVRYAG